MTTHKRKGRFPKLQERDLEVLRAVMSEYPGASLTQYNDMLAARTGICVSLDCLSSAMKRGGIKRVAPSRGEDQRYRTSLTDAEWELVSELFEWEGGLGKPPKYPRRLILDACCYVIRTGCAWRMLPKSFPPWSNVYKLFRRWTTEGRFKEMHERFRRQWCERAEHGTYYSMKMRDTPSTRNSVKKVGRLEERAADQFRTTL